MKKNLEAQQKMPNKKVLFKKTKQKNLTKGKEEVLPSKIAILEEEVILRKEVNL